MRKSLVNALLLIALICMGSWAPADHHRWPIKTHPLHRTNPNKQKLLDIVNLGDPPGVTMNDSRYENEIIPAFPNSLHLKEGDYVRIEGYMHLVAYEDNDDEYHIQLSGTKESGNNCLIVEVPHPKNVDDAGLKANYEAVRSFVREKILNGNEPSKGGNVIGGRAYVYVIGQLFYDDSHTHNQVRGKKGMRSNTLWEVHPIVKMGFAPLP